MFYPTIPEVNEVDQSKEKEIDPDFDTEEYIKKATSKYAEFTFIV
jgi:hypothetical protein